MQIEIPIGHQGHETKIVEKKDTAKHIGSGLAEVFSTPAMIALMEYTAFTSIEPFLPEGYSSVGIQINAYHKKASLPGSIITCKSNVTMVEGKKIFFTINAWDEEGEIGSSEHVRYIINTVEFLKKIEKK